MGVAVSNSRLRFGRLRTSLCLFVAAFFILWASSTITMSQYVEFSGTDCLGYIAEE